MALEQALGHPWNTCTCKRLWQGKVHVGQESQVQGQGPEGWRWGSGPLQRGDARGRWGAGWPETISGCQHPGPHSPCPGTQLLSQGRGVNSTRWKTGSQAGVPATSREGVTMSHVCTEILASLPTGLPRLPTSISLLTSPRERPEDPGWAPPGNHQTILLLAQGPPRIGISKLQELCRVQTQHGQI